MKVSRGIGVMQCHANGRSRAAFDRQCVLIGRMTGGNPEMRLRLKCEFSTLPERIVISSFLFMSPAEIFFSYAHEDEGLMDAVRRQLIVFERKGLLIKWHDRQIPAGQEWHGQIDDNLRRAKIILFFVSPHFIESRYICDVEVAEALTRHKAGEATVIPVILRPCPWQELFGNLQAVPKDGRPITQWANQDEACLDAANRIVEVVRSFDESRTPQHTASSIARRSEHNEVAETRKNHDNRPEIERDILLLLVQNSRCTDRLLSQKLNVGIERIRFHLDELEKDEFIYGRHFYGGQPSDYCIAQEGRRYLNDRDLLS